ncbi:type II toxin-antitoxin system CcdA family antitoxin [Croceibacterium sp. LX-88]|uniref:Type II toxin-antitoxin system CcdA family antitoxin n=1 Tax=Croceibacterium selenioxidans TaxID=2838833 RepID=A0ABS5W547_9SPHN|nr:type II toxin-antitoxin system CcdA family antitoxin [Croceibacterium selenioxidans]MBT2133509.1 type II toxin-antitoxin system CcdA family antitoxin [Croceibacterium selenioxidans]
MPQAALAKTTPSSRRPTNVSLGREHLEAARELGINISQACERGLVETIAEVRASQWTEANREALDSYNAYVEAHGLPLEKQRLF